MLHELEAMIPVYWTVLEARGDLGLDGCMLWTPNSPPGAALLRHSLREATDAHDGFADGNFPRSRIRRSRLSILGVV